MSHMCHSNRFSIFAVRTVSFHLPVLISLLFAICFTGDEPEHRDPSTMEFYVAKVGYQVYCEYQKQLMTDVDGETM